MLSLIIGLLIAIGGAYGVLTTYNLIFTLLYVIGLGVIVVTLLQPLAGWGERKIINQYDLIPLMPNSEHYVIQDKHGNLMYKFKDEDGNEIIRYSTLMDTNYDTKDANEKPILKKIQLKPKKTLWSFPIFCSKRIQYVIKIPNDKLEITILK